MEDLSVFLADFGVPASWYGAPWAIDRSGASLDSTQFGPTGLQTQTGLVLFDAPDTDVLSKRVQTTGYKITFPSAQFVGIKHADAVVISGSNFSVLTVSSRDDGAFYEATLQMVITS